MIFTSITFLLFFMVLMASFLIVKKTSSRQTLLLLASYFFYGAWNIYFIPLIIVSSIWGWLLGLLMYRANNVSLRKIYLFISLALSLSMLGYFKYANFVIENLSMFFGVEWPFMEITLPVGISFFTFQTMSYTIDLYRERIDVCLSLKKFMLFVAFFPQLVAGPIVRASDFLPQLDKKIKLKWDDLKIGSQIFLGGAIQKALIADNLSVFVDPVFADPGLFSAGTLWLSCFAYSIQIFCDFSGYSLMAIGIARMFGFVLPENFRMPYISQSITEFWRRWHISLSTWLRDYLYISLGGNRKGRLFTYANLLITMLLGGLWHGASWNFVLWGFLHGVGLAIHKVWCNYSENILGDILNSIPYKIFSWLLTMSFVALLWVPFRSKDFNSTLVYFKNMLPGSDGIEWMHDMSIYVLICVLIWHVLYLNNNKVLFSFPTTKMSRPLPAFYLGFFLLLIVLVAPTNTSPFIYFQF